MRSKVIIDCDTGRDDAVAIGLALASTEEIDLLGITTVAGNVPLALTQRNTRFICELCGRRDVKVFAGAPRPLIRPLLTAENAHGQTGLDGMEVREPQLRLQDRNAVDFIIETLRHADDGSITLVPTGPLTNIALVLIQAPDVAPKIKQIVVMGGARLEGGNVTPTAEFNILVDPDAARVVFGCGRPIVAFGLDVTYQVLATPGHAAALEQKGGVARKLAPLFRASQGPRSKRLPPNVTPLHDACTIAWLIEPGLFGTKHVNVEVETAGGLTLGQTVVDYWGRSSRPANVHWAHEVNSEAVLDLIIGRLARHG